MFSNEFDRIRADNHDLAFAVYAYEPDGVVILEVITPDQSVFTWRAKTLAEALDLAFPAKAEASAVIPDIFD